MLAKRARVRFQGMGPVPLSSVLLPPITCLQPPPPPTFSHHHHHLLSTVSPYPPPASLRASAQGTFQQPSPLLPSTATTSWSHPQGRHHLFSPQLPPPLGVNPPPLGATHRATSKTCQVPPPSSQLSKTAEAEFKVSQ